VFTLTITSLPAPDFTLTANPTSITLAPEDSEVCQGQPATTTCDDEGQITITVTALNDFTGQVTLSVSSSPHLSTELTTTTISTSGASTLRISEAPPGNYVLTVTGTSGSLSHSVTVNVTVRSPEKLKCGGDSDCNIESDAPLSNANFAGHIMHFTMTGDAGTTGAANVTIARSAVPDINRIKVSVDHNELSKSDITITSDGNNYHIYFKVTFHSNVDVDIDLNPATTILGLDPTIFYSLSGGLTVAVVAIGALAYRASRKKPKP